MYSILIFASIALGLASTLLYGPQWGVVMGIMTYLAGNSTLLGRELSQIKTSFQKIMNELPDLVNDLVEQRLKDMGFITDTPPALSSTPAAKEEDSIEKVSALSELDQRFSALDSKLSALVELLAAREAAAAANSSDSVSGSSLKADQAKVEPPLSAIKVLQEPEHVVPTTLENADKQNNASQIATPPAIGPHSAAHMDKKPELAVVRELVEKASAILAHQENCETIDSTNSSPKPLPVNAFGTQHPFSEKSKREDEASQNTTTPAVEPQTTAAPADKGAELAAMHDLVEKITALLAQQENYGTVDPANTSPQRPHIKAPSRLHPSYDHLRNELDKIASELRNELNRPKS